MTMKMDRYTKTVFTLICLFLGILAIRPLVLPTPGFADYGDKFERYQFSVNMQGAYFFDTKTGEIWNYIRDGSNIVVQKMGTIKTMGEPLQ
jgi:hypothetical protein